MSSRILFIGLDSAEPELLLRWSREGRLPVLQSLLQSGAWTVMKTTAGFGNGAVWPTVFTGVNPGRHGRYYASQLKRGSYDMRRFCEDTDFKYPPLWERLSNQGKQVVVVDMVRAPLSERLNGLQLADWTTHDRRGPTRSWPASFASEVVDDVGSDPIGGNIDRAHQGGTSLEQLVGLLDVRIKMKTSLSLDLLARNRWDLFMTVFGEPHDVGHLCWHLHDSIHPRHDPEWTRTHGDPLEQVYRALDTAIGRLIAQADDETTVLVFSGPGMGPNYTANPVLEQVLRRLDDRAIPTRPTSHQTVRATYRRVLPEGLRKLIRRVPGIQSRVRRGERTARWSDLGRQRYFALPHNDNSGAVRINLIGREPFGRVKPGAEFDALCDWLAKQLLSLVDPDTRMPIVQEVVRVADICHGDSLDDLPDLLVVWNRGSPFSAVSSKAVGEIRLIDPVHRTGDHTPRALFVARGPGTRQGEFSASLEDIAPTIAMLSGVPEPEGDGQSLEQICRHSE